MPGAGLLQRAKSLLLKEPKSQSSDIDEPDMLNSQFIDAQSFRNQHRYGHSQFTGTHSRPVSPAPDLVKRDVFARTGHDRYKDGQSDTSSIKSSSRTGYSAIPEELMIGLALGSPRENPLPPIPPDGAHEDVSSVCSSLGSPAIVRDHNSADLALQKGRKWRTFTGLFNKKDASSHLYLLGPNSPHRDLPYQYKSYQRKAPEQFPARSVHHNRQSDYSSRLPRGLDRQLPPRPRRGIFRGGDAGLRRQIGWRNTQFRKEHRRDVRNPAVNKSRSWPLSYSARKGPKPPPKNGITARKASSSNLRDDSLLQVEIPSVHMERYSVMFSNLLEPAQPKSILARRQGTRAEIKLAPNDRNNNESIPGTRVDSNEIKHVPVQISKCAQDVVLPISGRPAVSSPPWLLSSNPAARSPLERSTLHPCHTATISSLLTEPKMETSKCHERNCFLNLDGNPIEPLGEEAASDRPASTLDLDRCHPPTTGRYSELPGCAELVDKDEVLPPLPLNPGVRKTSPLRHHGETSSTSTHSQFKLKDKTISDVAEISITRQISVSKRQRQLLVPIVSRQARQPMQPKLVIGSDQDAKSRKSHYLTVEHA